jgi:hypothetical protein
LWRGFVAEWVKKFGTTTVTATDLFLLASYSDDGGVAGMNLLGEILTGRNDRGRQTNLGNQLRKTMDQVFDIDGTIYRITMQGKSQGATRWALKVVDTKKPAQPVLMPDSAEPVGHRQPDMPWWQHSDPDVSAAAMNGMEFPIDEMPAILRHVGDRIQAFYGPKTATVIRRNGAGVSHD